jgi:hypothetical protein
MRHREGDGLGNRAASIRISTSPRVSAIPMLSAAGVTRAGLSTSRSSGWMAASSRTRSRVPSLLMPSTTTISLGPA